MTLGKDVQVARRECANHWRGTTQAQSDLGRVCKVVQVASEEWRKQRRIGGGSEGRGILLEQLETFPVGFLIDFTCVKLQERLQITVI